MFFNKLDFTLAGEGNQFWVMILFYAAIFGGFYFLFIRPQQKKKKQEEAMRKDLQVGDDVTTIGGISGKVVSIKTESNSLIIETSVDRSKIQIKDWAIASRDNLRPGEQVKTK